VVLRPKKLEIWKKKNCENCIRAGKPPTKYYAMKLSQICRRIELCMRPLGCRDPRGLTVHQQRSWSRGQNAKLIRYQFWCTRCASRLLKSFGGTRAEKVGNPKTIVKTVLELKNPNTCTMPWNWAKSVEG
jgi:hypothetical protein